MQAVYCLDCARSISVSDIAELGDPVICPHCASEFEVIDLDPIDIEWRYGDDAAEDHEFDAFDDLEEDEEDDDLDYDTDDWSHLIAKRQRVLEVDEREARRSDITPEEAQAQLQAKRKKSQTQTGYAQVRQLRDSQIE